VATFCNFGKFFHQFYKKQPTNVLPIILKDQIEVIIPWYIKNVVFQKSSLRNLFVSKMMDSVEHLLFINQRNNHTLFSRTTVPESDKNQSNY
jgi:hypothetical protein